MNIEEMKQLADEIRKTTEKLNKLSERAYNEGLDVDFYIHHNEYGFGPEESTITVKIRFDL